MVIGTVAVRQFIRCQIQGNSDSPCDTGKSDSATSADLMRAVQAAPGPGCLETTQEQLGHEIDLSGVEFDYLAHHKQATASSTPGGDVPLKPATQAGKGTAHSPEMVPLAEVIDKINQLFDGDHPESSVRNVITHVKDRLEESTTLQQQAKSNTIEQFSASPDLKSEFVSAVIGAMESHSDLSARILNNPEISQKLMGELVPLIYRALKATA
jgi:type I restriction enzyme R subunit